MSLLYRITVEVSCNPTRAKARVEIKSWAAVQILVKAHLQILEEALRWNCGNCCPHASPVFSFSSFKARLASNFSCFFVSLAAFLRSE